MMLTWGELPTSRGHVFYDRLQKVLRETGGDSYVKGVSDTTSRRAWTGPRYRQPIIGACDWWATPKGLSARAGSSVVAPTACR